MVKIRVPIYYYTAKRKVYKEAAGAGANFKKEISQANIHEKIFALEEW